MTSTLFRNVTIWDGLNDAAFPGEVLVENNRIKTVAKGRGGISSENASRTIDGAGQFLMPGMVEGHSHLSFLRADAKIRIWAKSRRRNICCGLAEMRR